MGEKAEAPLIEPVGHIASNIHRVFLRVINMRLAHMDIDRFYYAIQVIEASSSELTQQELAVKLGCDKVQVVRIIDYLAEKGYVTRTQNTSDRRKHGLKVTGKAKNFIPEIRVAVRYANELILKNLSEKKVAELYSTLKIIENNLSSFKSHSMS